MDPVEIARIAAEKRRDPGKWGLDETALALPANSTVVVEGQTRQNSRRAKRYDIFALLLARGAIDSRHVIAVDRLWEQIAIRYATEGGAESGEKVDGGGHLRSGITDRRLDALDQLDWVLHATGSGSAALLVALIEPGATRGQVIMNWRATVRNITGDDNPSVQIGHVRSGCENLSQAFAAWDKLPSAERDRRSRRRLAENAA